MMEQIRPATYLKGNRVKTPRVRKLGLSEGGCRLGFGDSQSFMKKRFPLFAVLVLLLAAVVFGAGSKGKLPPSSIAAETPDARLAIAAKKVGWTLDKVKAIAAKDRDLRISSDNRLFYVCRFDVNPGRSSKIQTGPDTSTYTSPPPTVDATSAFRLHSRPGASRTLYLDFTGHTTPAGLWESTAVTIPPFKLAGTANPTDQVNLNAIRDIWLHVAEDFAAWDIDVTTDDTGIATKPGQRCVIGGRQDALPSLAGFGTMGWAWVGSFANASDGNDKLDGNDTNNFVFIDVTNPATGENNTILNPTQSNYEVTILCVAHEVGHTLGLRHWGETTSGSGQSYTEGHSVAGHTGVSHVSPIMGNSALPGWPSVCNLNQWSKGDYAFSTANTGLGTQDDVTVISTFVPRLVGARDDYGDTLATATVVTETSITAGGVIADSSDVDLIKITPGVGALTLTATPHLKYRNYNGNLKVGLSLLDSTGTAVAKSYVTNSMGNTLTYNVTTAGTYYIKVNGLGYNPLQSAASQTWTNNGVTGTVVGTSAGFTNYGSIGRYGLTGTWQAFAQLPVAVITSDRSAGIRPVTVAFDGRSSTDTDGLVVGYSWNFGDPGSGAANTSTLANPVHTYSGPPGNYTATLTVTDNMGNASSPASKVITLSGAPLPNTLRVASMTASWGQVTRVEVVGSVKIKVVNQYGQPLRGAAVYVAVTGSASGKAAAKTDASGFVTINMPKRRISNATTYTFTVTSLALPSYTYDIMSNTPTNASITISR